VDRTANPETTARRIVKTTATMATAFGGALITNDEASGINAGTTWSEHGDQPRRVGTRHEGRLCNATVCVAQGQTCTRADTLNSLTMAKL